MTEIFFLTQIDRLKRRFGERHFDSEFIKLCAQEARHMSDIGLQRAVDVWIGARTHHKPPLLVDFREARLNEERFRLERDGKQSIQVLNREADRRGLKTILKEDFGNVSTAVEAIEFLTFKKRVEEAKANEEPPERAPDRDPDPGVA